MLNVAIAGAGIGGLAAALFLHEKGIEVRVFEGVAELRPLGVGINVMPHASKLLHELGAEGYAEALAEHRRLIRVERRTGDHATKLRGQGVHYPTPTHAGEDQEVPEGVTAAEHRVG